MLPVLNIVILLTWLCFAADLDTDIARLQTEINQARACETEIGPSGVAFCTGIHLSQPELESLLRMDRSKCISLIKTAGYKTADGVDSGLVPKQDWLDFKQSTLRALTFHDLKVVAFKEATHRIDCIHELIHVFQWTKKTSNPLAPPARKQKLDGVTQLLNLEADKIAVIEKSNPSLAQMRAKQLQTKIDIASEYSRLSDNLDEIEVHFFIYKLCPKLKCSEDDIEFALANLNRRKLFLSKSVAIEIEEEVKKRTNEKFARHSKLALASWIPLTQAEKALVPELLKKPWPELIVWIQNKGIRVIGVDRPNAQALGIAIPSPDESALLKDTKIMKAEALGKFLCQSKVPVIALTEKATKGTLVHEYLHFVQNNKNTTYCAAASKQPEVLARFSGGQIDKATYESTVITYQLVNAIAEREVYATLEDQAGKFFGTLERANNRELLKKYEQIYNGSTHTNLTR